MSAPKSRSWSRQEYAQAAMAYQDGLTLENIMEATPQANQRKITLGSLDLVHARRPEVQIFNELLVQCPLASVSELCQVVPDNMIVVGQEASQAAGSFDWTFEPAPPFCVLDYVSPHSRRKDYEENMVKYERDLKVPYYLRFDPGKQDLTLFRHNQRKFTAVKPNVEGRLAMPELDLEIGLMNGWARFWYKGELLLLPAELQRDLEVSRQRLAETIQLLEWTKQPIDQERQALQAAQEELRGSKPNWRKPGTLNAMVLEA